MVTLKEIDKIEPPIPGGSMPLVLGSDSELIVLYFYRVDDSREGVAMLQFDQAWQHKFGYPNEEVIGAHQYASLGLWIASIYELVGSSWPGELERMNSVHPGHSPGRYKNLKHFIITFQDSTFECLAAGVDVRYFKDRKMKEVFQMAGGILLGEY